MIVSGANFERVSAVHFGTVPATKIITTGAPTKGQCKVKFATELECATPFHEHGKVHTTVTNSAGTSAETPADEIAFLPEVYRNEVAVGANNHVPSIGYGQLLLHSPRIETFAECVNVGFGAGWNEGPPTTGHGEILAWWASGHTPTAENSELGFTLGFSSRCRFDYHGVEENNPVEPFAWLSAEPLLKLVNQEGIVCTLANQRSLSQCPNESERIHELVTRAVSREPPSVPWNLRFTERSEVLRIQIGLPEECRNKTGAERTELAKCPEASVREPGKNPEGCNIPPVPAPPGCVRVQMLTQPPLNVHLEYEGHLEPRAISAGPNGLSPSSWEFEGTQRGEPALRLSEFPPTEGVVTGSVKLLGFSGQELLSVK